MNKIILTTALLILVCGCSKMEDKKTTGDSKTPNQETQNTSGQNKNSQEKGLQDNGTQDNSKMDNKSSGQTDEKAVVIVKEADASIVKMTSDKSEEAKKEAIANSLAAANYLMFEANLPAREKYRPALKYYRKVLELDPGNAEAMKNKKQIEDIYEQMGMPVPQ